ncbi:hypothetical protein AM500_05125 [Bacillus sp. FJAT-18017]|uniref:J domain-containing protein n=1 Tax=Bacillus sp. FJAT-18017 TaxID=1705566 RepID=UPI0006AE1900|nr:tetratricopeptide repeat protein [Bacillus sp. FJAT-18017]ALC89233.1 hypothetical protein AM500_05125 [Bacillus sp. FJAT-18017]
MGDYYTILQVNAESSLEEIRSAYISLIKQYSNQTHPEQFQKIRKAYQILGNPVSRQEYDTMEFYGDKIRKLEEESECFMEEEDYHQAIQSYKRILMIDPSIHRIRNRLALALSYNGEHQKAISQFNKLINQHPEQVVYLKNFAYALDFAGETLEAISRFKEAISLEPEDVDLVYTLSGIFERMNDYRKARECVEQGLSLKKDRGYHAYFYFIKIVKLTLMERDSRELSKILDRIDWLLDTYEDEKESVAIDYAKIAYELNEACLYDWALKLTERAVKLSPDDDTIARLHYLTKEKEPIITEFNLLNKDDKIPSPLKFCFTLYIYGHTLPEDEYEKKADAMFDQIEELTWKFPRETIVAIKRMVIKYPSLFEAKQELLTKLLSLAEG